MARLLSRIVLAALVATALLSLAAHAAQDDDWLTLADYTARGNNEEPFCGGVEHCVGCYCGECFQCEDPYVITEDHQCTLSAGSSTVTPTQPTCTDPHCASCITNANVCDVCREGYTVVDAKCIISEGTATGASALWAAATTVVAVAVLATVA